MTINVGWCASCGGRMVPTKAGFQCPNVACDWHDECTLYTCGFDNGITCGIRDGWDW